jgi:hypothetical protein
VAGLFEPLTPPKEYQQSGAAEIYQRQLTLLPESSKGPQPWCRVCHCGVLHWTWDHYAGGFWGVTAHCHGDVCGGLLPIMADHWGGRVEVFCDSEPRLPEFPLWFVSFSGEELQPPQNYLQAAIKSGRELPVLVWIRKHVNFIIMLLVYGILAAVAVKKLTIWLLSR